MESKEKSSNNDQSMKGKSPPFLVIYDTNVIKSNVKRVVDKLNHLYTGPVSFLKLSDESIEKILDETTINYKDYILIFLSHCFINISDDGLTYFSGCSCPAVEQKFHQICEQFKYVWLAGCSTANTDVAKYTIPNIKSFVIDGGLGFPNEADFIPVVSINWLIEFFTLMWQLNNIPWWMCDIHPLRDFTNNPNCCISSESDIFRQLVGYKKFCNQVNWPMLFAHVMERQNLRVRIAGKHV